MIFFFVGMRIGLGCDGVREGYYFCLDIDPIIQVDKLSGNVHSTFEKAINMFHILTKDMKTLIDVGEEICQDLLKILEYFKRLDGVSSYNQELHKLDDPAQVTNNIQII